MVDKNEEVRDAVIHFVNTTNPEDDIFILEFNNDVSLVEDFTNDRQRLAKAIGRLRAVGSTAV